MRAPPDADQSSSTSAWSQLINDTNDPASAIRGHSLGRDMYGNDSIANEHQPDWANFAMEINCYLDQLPFLGNANLNLQPLVFQAVQNDPTRTGSRGRASSSIG